MSTSSSILGHWEGEAIAQGARLKIRLHFYSASRGTIDIPSWTTLDWPLSNLSIAQSSLYFEMPGNKNIDTFEGHYQDNTLTGEFQFWGKKAQFLAHRVPPEVAVPYTTKEVKFHNHDVTLDGTLFLPLVPTPYPCLLFTHGSGEETRDRNRFLADHFARQGIASLIYDKRGTGRSTGDWREADFEDLASDALVGIQFLKANQQINSDRIGIFGHSQGGWIATLAASQSGAITFMITVCSPAVTPAQQMEYANQMRAISGEAPQDISNLSRKILDFDPVSLLKTFSIPVLAVFGESDKLVNTQESIAILSSIKIQYSRDFTIHSFASANHHVMVFPDTTERFRWFGLAEGYLELLTTWVSQHTEA